MSNAVFKHVCAIHSFSCLAELVAACSSFPASFCVKVPCSLLRVSSSLMLSRLPVATACQQMQADRTRTAQHSHHRLHTVTRFSFSSTSVTTACINRAHTALNK
jgi:hypothetical protein